MRVGLIAPPWFPVPPPLYGGIEEVVDGLARGLEELGHEVRLFTLGDSTCPVPSEHLYETGIDPVWCTESEAAHILAAYEALADVDVIHDHTMIGPLLAHGRGMPHPPVVVTDHSDDTPANHRILTAVNRVATVVAISASQARRAAGVRFDAVVHHGVDLDRYRPGPGDGNFLLFVGRMTADKGVDAAIRIARGAGLPLRIVAKQHEAVELEYFEEVIRPMLREEDEPPAELGAEERIPLMQHATAVVDPIRWAEPFGLVMIESLACATPVVAFPNGASPEIVRPGVTGFLPSDEAEAVDSVAQVRSLDRAACRRDAEERFSLQRMARDYERVYRRMLEGEAAVPRQPTGREARSRHRNGDAHPPSSIGSTETRS